MNIETELKSRDAARLQSRVVRAQSTRIVPVIPNHYFAAASSEIRDMFIDGYFIGAISLSQSVAEGLSRFLCKRKHMPVTKDHIARVEKLRSENVITSESTMAFKRIEDGRNDFHHMNEAVESDYAALEAKAKLSVDSIFQIEGEIFGHSFNNGAIVPNNPEYWDINEDGTAKVSLRFSM